MEKKKTRVLVMEAHYDAVASEMANVVVDSMKEGYQSELETWEVYEGKVRAQMQENIKRCGPRFVHGYQALLGTLVPQAPPPPGESELKP